jgi:hypothetical protein
MAVEGEVTEQAHDVVCGHDEAEGGFRGPEVLETEGVESEVLLEFADPVLTIGPGIVDVPDLIQGKVEVGYLQTEAVVGKILEEQLP